MLKWFMQAGMMDGSEFDRESLGLRIEKKNITDVIKKIEAQVNYSFNDHVMDNYQSTRPNLMMEMRQLAQCDA